MRDATEEHRLEHIRGDGQYQLAGVEKLRLLNDPSFQLVGVTTFFTNIFVVDDADLYIRQFRHEQNAANVKGKVGDFGDQSDRHIGGWQDVFFRRSLKWLFHLAKSSTKKPIQATAKTFNIIYATSEISREKKQKRAVPRAACTLW